MKLKTLIVLISSTIVPCTPLQAQWAESFAAAIEQSQKENKDLCLIFTGGDWCPPCVSMEEQILSKNAFIEATSKQFVFYKLIYPEYPESDLSLERVNLAKKYKVEGYPTLVLTNATGRPYFTEIGAAKQTSDEFAEELNRKHERHLQFQRHYQASQSGDAQHQAKELAQALKLVPVDLLKEHYSNELERLSILDPTDLTGFQDQLKRKIRVSQTRTQLAELYSDQQFAKAILLIDALLQEEGQKLDICSKQSLLMSKSYAFSRLGKTGEAKATIQDMVKIDPTSEAAKRAPHFEQIILNQQK